MRFVFGSAHSRRHGIAFAHVCAVLRVSVISGSAEVVDFGSQIDPHNGICGAARLSLRFGRKFVRPDGFCRNAGCRSGGWRRRRNRSRRRSRRRRGRSGSSRCSRRSRSRSRRCCGCRGRFGGWSAAAALSYVSLFSDAARLIRGLVGPPLFPAFLRSLLLCHGNRR